MHPVAVARRAGRRRNAILVFVLFVALVTFAVYRSLSVLGAEKAPDPDSAAAVSTPEVRFSSPDKKLGCQLTDTFVRCDVRDQTWAAPPTPPDCVAPNVWGRGVRVDANPTSFFCAAESMLDAGPPLHYGDAVTRGDFSCSSRPAAMRCLNVKTQHGFSVSSTAVTKF
jgi:hypothetical protein